MALTVEDGTVVSGADSYLTLAELRAFATKRGVTLTTVDADLEVMSHKAIDYLEAYRDRYKGTKVDEAQPLQFPRDNVYVDGIEVGGDTIPDVLKNAQAQLVVELSAGSELTTNGDGRVVVRDKLGPIEQSFAVGGSGAPQPVFPAVNRWLAPLLDAGGGNLTNVRA